MAYFSRTINFRAKWSTLTSVKIYQICLRNSQQPKNRKSSQNTPGTRGGSGFRNRTLAKKQKNARKSFFFVKKNNNYLNIFILQIFLLDMPKYWGKQISMHGSFPKVGQKQKTVQKKKKERDKDRKLVITMASYALQRHLRWRTQAAWAKFHSLYNTGCNLHMQRDI